MNAPIAQNECFGYLFALVHKQKIYQMGGKNNQHILYKMSKLATPNPELLLYIMISELAELQQVRMSLKALPILADLYMD